MAEVTDLPMGANEVQGLEYLVVGLATCFQRDEEGRLAEVQVVEPIPAAEIDCLAREVRPSSYRMVYATTYAEVVQGDQPVLPSDVFPTESRAGDHFVERAQAATRSYRAKPAYQHVPLHQICTPESGVFKLNYNPEPKRILGVVGKVSDADNVKQHSHTHKAL